MAFKVKIKNIGKLEDAEVSIGQFTVFAGPNNTGKSFVSKLLYSLFNAMNANHVETHLNNLVGPVYRDLMIMTRPDRETRSDKATISRLSRMKNEAEKLKALIKAASIETLYNEEILSEEIIPELISYIKKIEQIASDIPQFPEKKMARGQRYYLESLMNSLAALKEKLSHMDTENFIETSIWYQSEQNLIQNFQVPNISALIREEGTPSKVEVGEFGLFELSDEGFAGLTHISLIEHLQQYSRVIYLESPIYWKLKTVLEDARDHPVHFGDRERLSGVPGYFYDLVGALKYEYTGDMAFPDVYAKLTGKSVMDGKIAISETGNLYFQENGRNFSLPVTAMGIANLGILALLIERKVLDKGTFLFIDEPEAHLHPAWQVIMAESLFELSRQGVNVVIATHSVDILKWLEVHVKKNPDDEQLIALNQFPVKNSNTEEDFETKMGKIMHELTKPFSDLYIEGI